ncbi:unnamed protein product [marine sediment metagenome]|uniref:Uncharacterized protein n=1 Tax=marine sediment metagenome TaxID=412755 RepID=X1UIK8_9ZZZZ
MIGRGSFVIWKRLKKLSKVMLEPKLVIRSFLVRPVFAENI